MEQSGATAGSKEFGSRERAAENQYARQKVSNVNVSSSELSLKIIHGLCRKLSN